MQVEQAPTSAALQSTAHSSAPAFLVGRAETPSDIEATQRLRYRVFVEEMGATRPRTRLRDLRPRLVEVGRPCIELEYRTSAAQAILWSDVVRFVRERGATHIVGCASISMTDGGVNAAAVHDHLTSRCLAPIEYRAFPRLRLAAVLPEAHPAPAITPLIRSYLHQRAWIGGELAPDSDFNTADLLFLLPLARIATCQAHDNHSEPKAA